MKWTRHRRVRILLASVAVVAAIATLLARLSRISKDGRPNEVVTWSRSQAPTASPTAQLPAPAQNNSAAIPPTLASPAASTSPALPGRPSISPASLIIPVAGVQPEQLRDTFSQPPSDGRIPHPIYLPA